MLRINDTDYGTEEIEAHRQLIVQLRAEMLLEADFKRAALLSVTVGLLSELVTSSRKETSPEISSIASKYMKFGLKGEVVTTKDLAGDVRSVMSDIVARLRQYEGDISQTTMCYNGAREEAAAEIEALREALVKAASCLGQDETPAE